ncbi:MAG: hypothetical protein EZS28_028744 [Streblomastix strix]|uniref:Uncharacterized protein n=1 Tax=Streblomastix strix TaxID=222440 RepID=A0A5J4UZ18_9EUKA|nr:MAG: hypothetical protein EZS28_028744 [Streblomastix strix]
MLFILYLFDIAIFPLAAETAFSYGTLATIGLTLFECQCVWIEYTLVVPAVPVPVSFQDTVSVLIYT